MVLSVVMGRVLVMICVLGLVCVGIFGMVKVVMMFMCIVCVLGWNGSMCLLVICVRLMWCFLLWVGSGEGCLVMVVGDGVVVDGCCGVGVFCGVGLCVVLLVVVG